MKAGNYRAITEVTIELCRSNGTGNPSVVEYATYQPGEEFEIPTMVNRYYHRVQIDIYHETSPGQCERVRK